MYSTAVNLKVYLYPVCELFRWTWLDQKFSAVLKLSTEGRLQIGNIMFYNEVVILSNPELAKLVEFIVADFETYGLTVEDIEAWVQDAELFGKVEDLKVELATIIEDGGFWSRAEFIEDEDELV